METQGFEQGISTQIRYGLNNNHSRIFKRYILWAELFALLLCLIAVLGACSFTKSSPDVVQSSFGVQSAGAVSAQSYEPTAFEPYNLPLATVEYVVDGDTLFVTLEDGSSSKVRLIGVDAPESVNPDEEKNTDEGAECSAYVKTLVKPGDTIWLESDVSNTDKYDRLLRYVWLHNPDTTDITFDLGTLNAHLVYYGYAEAKDYEPDIKHSNQLHALASADPPRDGTTPIGPLKRLS